MISDSLADALTIIRNGYAARLPKVRLTNSKLNRAVCGVLNKYGFVGELTEKEAERALVVRLRYVFDDDGVTKKAVIKHLSRVSKPGRRVYFAKEKLTKIRGGLGMLVISTPQGVMSGDDAKVAGIGGEPLCKVW